MKKIIFIHLLSAFCAYSYSEVHIYTIDNWLIRSISEEDLVVSKWSEESDNLLSLEMFKPYCVCSGLRISLNGHSKYKEGTDIEGTMRLDNFRKQKVKLKLTYVGKGYNTFQLTAFPNIRGKTILNLHTEYGEATFVIAGLKEVMKQSERICETQIDYLKKVYY